MLEFYANSGKVNILWIHETNNILTTVMTNFVVDKSTDNAEHIWSVNFCRPGIPRWSVRRHQFCLRLHTIMCDLPILYLQGKILYLPNYQQSWQVSRQNCRAKAFFLTNLSHFPRKRRHIMKASVHLAKLKLKLKLTKKGRVNAFWKSAQA